jgi:hypothetical protein
MNNQQTSVRSLSSSSSSSSPHTHTHTHLALLIYVGTELCHPALCFAGSLFLSICLHTRWDSLVKRPMLTEWCSFDSWNLLLLCVLTSCRGSPIILFLQCRCSWPESKVTRERNWLLTMIRYWGLECRGSCLFVTRSSSWHETCSIHIFWITLQILGFVVHVWNEYIMCYFIYVLSFCKFCVKVCLPYKSMV